MEPFILCENLVKIYKVSGLEVVALQGLNLAVQPGELMGIVGASGSGKSTLLNILGGLDRPSAGRVTVNDRDLLKAPAGVLDEYRRTEVGFVWQQTARNLIPYLSAQENVELPMTIEGVALGEKQDWAQELLETVGLWEHRKHRLAQLSGGQQQRVAIAVALANKPQLLLGDEPTGEVDSGTAQEILALFRRLNEQYGLTTIIVTHDPQVARAADRVMTIRDGSTSSETVRRVADVEAALRSAASSAVSPGAQEMSAAMHVYEEFVVVDGAGRLQIPPNLREEMGIGDRVTLERADDGILIRPASGLQSMVSPAGEISSLPEEPQPPPRRTGLGGWLRRHRRDM
jgi:ABC-type lipoprotein export system ATPase subunit/bifunctional DNA-binding transcriptional regulator/antitoxin component of YhaV-PrlF toxin-antitoxin module